MFLVKIIAIAAIPFIKEIFFGKKLVDPDSVRPGTPAENKLQYRVLSFFAKSRKTVCALLAILALSLIVNVRLYERAKALQTQVDLHCENVAVEPKETKTVPKKVPTEKDILFEKTKKELHDLYGELK